MKRENRTSRSEPCLCCALWFALSSSRHSSKLSSRKELFQQGSISVSASTQRIALLMLRRNAHRAAIVSLMWSCFPLPNWQKPSRTETATLHQRASSPPLHQRASSPPVPSPRSRSSRKCNSCNTQLVWMSSENPEIVFGNMNDYECERFILQEFDSGPLASEVSGMNCRLVSHISYVLVHSHINLYWGNGRRCSISGKKRGCSRSVC